MPKQLDLVGRVFGRLTVINLSRRTKNPYRGYWLCKCSCGRDHEVVQDALLSTHTRSCGCLSKETVHHVTHGLTGTPTYKIWLGIRKRCLDKNSGGYHKYGGRGIKMCESWKSDFLNFLKDMGEKPEGLSIERKNNDGNYEPKNCKWASNLEQAQNKRNIIETPEKKGLKQIARNLGITYSYLHKLHRIKKLTLEESIKLCLASKAKASANCISSV